MKIPADVFISIYCKLRIVSLYRFHWNYQERNFYTIKQIVSDQNGQILSEFIFSKNLNGNATTEE